MIYEWFISDLSLVKYVCTVHTGEILYSCVVWQKRFTEKGNMKLHKFVHIK